MKMFIFVWILGSVQSEICYDNARDGEARSGFCCNNYEEKNGICVECEIGYVSRDGFPCQPCPFGFWERKCRNLCMCQHNESCDKMYGCVERTTGVQTTLEEKYVPEKVESTFTEPKDAMHVITTSDSFSDVDQNDGILRQWKLIVSLISVGSTAIIVTLALCCFKNKKKAEHLNKARSKTVNRYHLSIKQEHDSKDNTSEYDLIDYSVINNDSLIRIVTSKPMENYNLN